MGEATDSVAIREAFAALARSIKRVAVYRHARDQHAQYLEPAVAEFRTLLEQRHTVTVAVEPTALLHDGDAVHTEPARDTGFCFRLHRDGVRSLSFRRGLGVDDLLALTSVALADPQADGGREDAVTELWKADLQHISYTAIAGYRMDEAAGGELSRGLGAISERVQATLDQHVGGTFVDAVQQPVLWTPEQRGRRDPESWPDLARRAALTILRIVEQDYAGWDLEALEESFWRLLDQMLERGETLPLAHALDKTRRLGGAHAGEFRNAVARKLSDPVRLERVVQMVTGSERPPLLPAWLALLPPDAAPSILAALPLGRDPAARVHLATALLTRSEPGSAQVDSMLRRGGAPEALAVLTAAASLPAVRRAELAVSALANPDPAVKLEAIPLLVGDPAVAVRSLGPLLQSPLRPVRLSAAQAIAGCYTLAEPATAALLGALGRPQFAQADKEEQTALYRAVGKLGAQSGMTFLIEQLSKPPRKLFGRRKGIEEQLLAVQGLAEEGSSRALRVLEETMLPERGAAPAVVAACRAAAQHLAKPAQKGRA